MPPISAQMCFQLQPFWRFMSRIFSVRSSRFIRWPSVALLGPSKRLAKAPRPLDLVIPAYAGIQAAPRGVQVGGRSPRARPAPSGARACGSLHRLERSEGAWRLDCRFRGNDKGAASEPELAEAGMVVRARPTGQRNLRSVSAIGRSLMLAMRRRLLDETAVELTRPFALEERDDRGPSLDEFDSISPATVLGVCERHTLRVGSCSRYPPPDGPSARRSRA
jgi:hypothetical protein